LLQLSDGGARARRRNGRAHRQLDDEGRNAPDRSQYREAAGVAGAVPKPDANTAYSQKVVISANCCPKRPALAGLLERLSP
jgi:hypothetical protein